MAHIQERGASILSMVDPDGPLDAALLLRQTGILVAGWTRDAVPQEVLTVMAFEALFDRPVHVAVLETGLGGEYDASNVAL